MQKLYDGLVWHAMRRCRPHFVWAATFSALINCLYLTPTIYMLQVYNRVLPTGGLPTLFMLSLIGVVALTVLATLELLRSRLLVRASARFDAELAGPTLTALMSQTQISRIDRQQVMREFDTLRQAMAGPGVLAALDAPWAPIYILAAFLLHPALGLLTLLASGLLLVLAWCNEKATHGPLKTANETAAVAYAKQAHASSLTAEVRALGMQRALTARHLADRAVVSRSQTQASFVAGRYSSSIKLIRLVLQSAALGLGAALVVKGALSAGAIFAASLLLSRALAPIEQIVGGWKGLVLAHGAYRTLIALFAGCDERVRTALPAPTGLIQVEGLSVLTPQNDRIAIDGASFVIKAGETIGVVGLSGAGKTTLLRALAGAVSPTRGHVRFDGGSAQDWDPELLAREIGYLPQDFALFPGSVKENISRFRIELGENPNVIDVAVVKAAQAVGAHDMIVRLPKGYDTPIGMGGVGMSAGQTQRIALARALFGNPRIVILDEPNAHLDVEADHALIKTLSRLRIAGVTVVVAAHSGDLLASMDKLLLLQAGRVVRFGPLSGTLTPGATPVSHQSPEIAK